MTIVEIDELSVHAADRPIVDSVTLRVGPAEIVGLSGPSGAGKTTLLHTMIGRLTPGVRQTAGTVRVCGADPFSSEGRRALRGLQVTYLPQDAAGALNPAHRVRWHLDQVLRRTRPALSRTHRAEEIDRVLDSVRLPPRLLRSRPAELSGGQAQRVALAAALLPRPRLLLLDEPTSNVGAATARELATVLGTAIDPMSIVVVSHDADFLTGLAHRVEHVSDGRIVPAPRRRCRPQERAPSRRDTVAALTANEITIAYGSRELLVDGSFSVGRGECLAIRGESGAGKSSLARCLAGLQRPRSGVLALDGRPIPWPVTARQGSARIAVSYVEQDSQAALAPWERVSRTLHRARVAALRHGLSPMEEPDLLAAVGLPPDVAERTPGQLSGGQRQRVNLIRALASCPEVLICDEVTASLDEATEAHVLDTLDGIRARLGLTVVLITHSDRVAAHASRSLHLAESRLT
ncbi:ABC transporter ATP-binding protein [Actinoalloteichus hymeniacidonis]|uniref:Peptide ABC transporter ATP-binding protein n=1 Tax=Actinoalloteichus hymeniacidonis TaxID=340345 RepID=A0AAC9HQL8_9PSEU|nr:ATP-binding cassette domain-containing protein [Actinoalloteichus hymeniacidonis]AOS63709.1 putative peptide ABC transporter ATP-binding protein [Actinoalloteichus hymeniacidonis]MBB5908238.1 peptide/nickel transport system ATP-binding protein [Actinoalloteichus hymeniacidonis]